MSYVAIEDMVEITDGAIMFPPAVNGAWSHSDPTVIKMNKLKVDGDPVIRQVTCVFTFNGTDAFGVPVIGSSTITFNPNTTVLKVDSYDLLVVGNSISDTYGNTIQISNGQTKLKTS
jgi:hypothetical protein